MSEKWPKGRFFAPGKLENHTSEGKVKEKKKERGGRKETRKKAMVALLVFMLASLEAVLAQKKLLDRTSLFGGNVFKNPA